MAGLNKVMLIGNLGKDPEMRYTANGAAVTSFSLAVSRTYTGNDGERKEETEWFDITTWNKQAELVSQFLSKGRKAYVEGRLHTRSYEDKEGIKRYRTEVIADRVLFLDSAQGGGQRPMAAVDRGYDDAPGGGGGGNVDPDDLPFE